MFNHFCLTYAIHSAVLSISRTKDSKCYTSTCRVLYEIYPKAQAAIGNSLANIQWEDCTIVEKHTCTGYCSLAGSAYNHFPCLVIRKV